MTINTAMLIALGFLVAALLAVLVMPAYRRRTVRLTTDALKRSLPLTEAEMRADKDRLRADHAIRIHNLEAKLESLTLGSARQKIEVNRRDARISELEGLANQQKTQVEELENARRVLEQTVTDRLPKIEMRLSEAKTLLQQRDREVATLAQTAQKQARALAEASQINTSQIGEIERLTAAISTRAARNQTSAGDARFDSEIALRSELDALRAKSRDQGSLIVRLQDLIASPATGSSPEAVAAVAGAIGAVQASTDEESHSHIVRLQSELSQARASLLSTQASMDARSTQSGTTDVELSRLRTTNQDMAGELAGVRAALSAFEASDGDAKTKDSPIAVKAKLSSLEALSRELTLTIASLRAEVSALNERLARQSAHYMDEMKRLGAGSLPASGEARRLPPEPAKRALADRINDPRVVRLTPLADKKAVLSETQPTAPPTPEPKPASPFSLNDQTGSERDPVSIGAAANDTSAVPASAAAPAQVARRPRLLERITSIDKPSST
jgi:chromosome segregation ATPase